MAEKEEGTEVDPVAIYFDITIQGESIGRLGFRLAPPEMLPLHIENVRQLCTGERRPIDPLCSYAGCAFEHSPSYVEGAQYKWSHVLKGRGRNAVGRPKEAISDPAALAGCAHTTFGGTYYGLEYDAARAEVEEACGILLAVPVSGVGRGSSRFTIIRVGDSPPAWKERLLLNMAVIGTLESGASVLRAMAQQRTGPPVISSCGIINED